MLREKGGRVKDWIRSGQHSCKCLSSTAKAPSQLYAWDMQKQGCCYHWLWELLKRRMGSELGTQQKVLGKLACSRGQGKQYDVDALRESPCVRKKGCLLHEGHRYRIARDKLPEGASRRANALCGACLSVKRLTFAVRCGRKGSLSGKLELAKKRILYLTSAEGVRIDAQKILWR